MKKGQKPHLLSEDERKEKLGNLTAKIAAGDRDASVAIGFPASESAEFATTSGLVSDLDVAVTESDVYYSWIGAGLAIGVSGGYCIFSRNRTFCCISMMDGISIENFSTIPP